MNLVAAPAPNSTSAITPRLESFSFCPACLAREFFQPADRDRTWMHCGKERTAIRFIDCPSCHRKLEFLGQPRCPFCQANFPDGVPLRPYLEPKRALDRLLKHRGDKYDRENQRTEAEFAALYASWSEECNGTEEFSAFEETRFRHDLEGVQAQHHQLLAEYAADIEKFLYGAPIRLAKFEAEYSWKFDQEVVKEVDLLLEGMLRGRHSIPVSLPFLARCRERFPEACSRNFLASELKRRFHERRQVSRPLRQLTLEYARTLSGLEFEEWLACLLRDAGISGVSITQASRDQGADLVITIGERKLVMQAKQYQDTIGNSAVQQAHGALSYYGATEAWVVTTSSFSKDAIDLAYRTGVRLVSGGQLLNLPALVSEANSDGLKPAVVAHLKVDPAAVDLRTKIAPARKALVAESPSASTAAFNTIQAWLRNLPGLWVLRGWKPGQKYAACGAAIVLLMFFVAGLVLVRGRRSGFQSGAAQLRSEVRKRVPRSTLPRPAPHKPSPVAVQAPRSVTESGEPSEVEAQSAPYVPSKYSHWYTIENANGEITVLNSTYTHLHVVSNAPVRVDMSNCHKDGAVDFECESQAGMVTVTDLSGSAGTRVLLELR